ncbi:metallophosphoesterase [bacterium]|nr:metallophosphoesterase [bacterium]
MDSVEVTASLSDFEVNNVTADTETADDNARQPIDTRERTLMAVGDLHGDYWRFLRYLREMNFLLPGTLSWNPLADRVDLILIGDYTDWRGEPLEAPFEETKYNFVDGPRRTIELIVTIKKEIERLRRNIPGFDSRFFPLLGNHDLMMMQSSKVTDYLSIDFIKNKLITARNYLLLRAQLSAQGLNGEQVEEALGFINWWVQGGEGTADGFGGLEAWAQTMNAGAREFLEDNLYLGVVVNNRLFTHSLPDTKDSWRPLQHLAELPESEYNKIRESVIWGRRIWGYDYISGTRTAQFTENEIRKMLDGFQCGSCVIGHTPLSRDTDHVMAYDNRIINIDAHGSPGSKAFIETYTPTEHTPIQAPLRSHIMKGSSIECRII